VGVQQTVVCPTHGTADTADLVFFTDVDEALLPNVGFPAYSGRPPEPEPCDFSFRWQGCFEVDQ